uniref:PhaM family polyhydroxyalkanoate granule multifunctional regulatory protein n=1 Tax=Castellaniella defragrans TaxID=75697 RepID=UPI0033406F9F
MSKESSNPFVLPGFGQDGEAARNPLFAGLEMMRQAWQGMAGGSFESAGLPLMSIEDLDRRIGELRSVQNWLQLNASILGNTIQGLEIQRATLSTLRAFADQGMPGAFASGADHAAAAADAPAAPDSAAQESDSARRAAQQDTAEAAPDSAHDTAATQAYAQVAGEWWNLLQRQFQTLADATAATLQGAPESATDTDSAPAAKPPRRQAAKAAAATKAPEAPKTARASKTSRTSGSGANARRGKPRT